MMVEALQPNIVAHASMSLDIHTDGKVDRCLAGRAVEVGEER